jgi:hypothetical protein
MTLIISTHFKINTMKSLGAYHARHRKRVLENARAVWDFPTFLRVRTVIYVKGCE